MSSAEALSAAAAWKYFTSCYWNGIEILEQPRAGKPLLILDIDQTIFDLDAIIHKLYLWGPRPYLQSFLEEAYKSFDIALWSATSMECIKKKVVYCDIVNKENYKISFYADEKLMRPVFYPEIGAPIQVKPLPSIWKQMPYYNERNTLICDDLKENFYFNINNGIPVAPYSYKNFLTDDELIKLPKYLNYLAHSSMDFSDVNHFNWRNHPSVV